MVTRRSFLATSTLAAAGSVVRVAPARAQSAEKLTFGTNWKAQAEHGGYYQAVANGIYKKAGLDVTIRMGGPQINHPPLLADAGYSTYATTIETSSKLINEKPDVVQRFVDATIEGWYSYLYGDPGPANALIKKDNPEMDDAQIAHSIATLKKYGVADSGD